MLPGEVAGLEVYFHLGALELVELLTYRCLVLRRESRPRLVRAPVVVVRLRHFDVVVEADNLYIAKRRMSAHILQDMVE